MHQIIPSVVPASGNFADLVMRHCRLQPYVTALNIPQAVNHKAILPSEEISYGELGDKINRFRALLRAKGLNRQDRVVVMFKPCVNLYALVLALLAEGMIPVFIDTGMGPRKMLNALEASQAKLIVAPSTILHARWVIPAFWGRLCISADKVLVGVKTLDQLAVELPLSVDGIDQCVVINESDHGLISFTSGSTGRPKGADRTHDSLIQQHIAIRDHWPDNGHDIDMTSLPVVVLHNLCCGMPTILPAINFAAPGSTDGHKVLSQIASGRVTRLSGAPAFVEQLTNRALRSKEHGSQSSTFPLRSISLGGAPVTVKLAQKMREAFPHVHSRVVYGSTEAEPIASIDIGDIIEDQKTGYLVGVPAHQSQVMIVKLPEDIDQITDDSLASYYCMQGEVGELVVKGRHVLRGYVDNPDATKENKIHCKDGTVWHRTGDIARVDESGRLWLMGRLSDVIHYQGHHFLTYAIESKVDAIPGVKRSALVQNSIESKPAMVFECEKPAVSDGYGADETELNLRHAIMKLLLAEGLSGIDIVGLEQVPVDSRHNSKIDRAKLRKML